MKKVLEMPQKNFVQMRQTTEKSIFLGHKRYYIKSFRTTLYNDKGIDFR